MGSLKRGGRGHGERRTAGGQVLNGIEPDEPLVNSVQYFAVAAAYRPLLTGKRHQGEMMSERSGPFWDVVEGRAPLPRAAATLGLEVIRVDVDEGTIELSFTATDDFTNPTGNVLGAFVAAMLYDTVGPALLATLEPDQFQTTLDLHVTFLRPVRPGKVIGRGRVVHRVGDTAFLEASLVASEDLIATATAQVIPLDRAQTAA
jgi:uncharacterized protein (TIGR00369 family)